MKTRILFLLSAVFLMAIFVITPSQSQAKISKALTTVTTAALPATDNMALMACSQAVVSFENTMTVTETTAVIMPVSTLVNLSVETTLVGQMVKSEFSLSSVANLFEKNQKSTAEVNTMQVGGADENVKIPMVNLFSSSVATGSPAQTTI